MKKLPPDIQDSRYGLMRDRHGREIRPGDLLKTPHFREARYRRMNYLYHTVVVTWDRDKPYFGMVPTSHLEPTEVDGGGSCALMPELAAAAEVIHGHGPGDRVWWQDRPKLKIGGTE